MIQNFIQEQVDTLARTLQRSVAIDDVGINLVAVSKHFDDADDARSVAYRLGMKFYVFNEAERFAREVMDRFVAEYCAGHTPNPCIDCNRCLKFGSPPRTRLMRLSRPSLTSPPRRASRASGAACLCTLLSSACLSRP